MKALFCDDEKEIEAVKERLKNEPLETNLSARITTPRSFPIPNRGHKVVLVDFGCKYGVIRELSNRDCDMLVVPCTTALQEIMTFRPDGIVLSGGAGNPADCKEAMDMIKECKEIPMLGIGLGAGVLALASGASLRKMKTGHHGNSLPVRCLKNNRIEFTAENRGYEIDQEQLGQCEVTYVSLNDQASEGFKLTNNPWTGVFFNPEGAPGDSECCYVFDEFLTCLKERGTKNA